MTSQLPSPSSSQREATDAPDVSLAHLVFLVDSQPYACRAVDIARLLLLADSIILPNPVGAPAWEVGRLQVPGRETAIPIISLRRLWGLPAQPEASVLGRQALLVARVTDEPYALLADACQCVLPSLPRNAASLSLPAPLTGTAGSAFQSALRWKESLLVVVDLHQLLPAVRRATRATGSRISISP